MPGASNPFTPPHSVRVRMAQRSDAEPVTRLINAAFVVEQIAFDGDRIDILGVCELMKKGAFLLAEDPAGLAGCVFVETRGGCSYLGLLSVAPIRQGSGLGRRLVAEAEEYARSAGCHTMDLRIISPRAESLLPFYRRLGYVQTGTAQLSSDVTPKMPSHYITMAKSLQ
jgi:GNAT superfamily N-acetyltransferase